MNQTASLHGLRILVVEDETMVALMLEDMLDEFGCVVVDVAGTLSRGLALVASEPLSFDGAILDVNLGGERVYPVATRLAECGVPFIFCTGYGRGGLDAGFAHVPTLAKPYMQEDLQEILVTVMGEAARH